MTPDVSKLIVGGPYDADRAWRHSEPADHFRLPPRTTRAGAGLRANHSHNARAPGVPASGDERRHPAAVRVLQEEPRHGVGKFRQPASRRPSRRCSCRRNSCSASSGILSTAAERHGSSRQRRRARVAPFVLLVEHHSRRRASRPGRTRQAERSVGAGASGAADARRPARRHTGVELRGPVAPTEKRRNGEAGSGHFPVRRSAAPVVPHRDGAVRLECLSRGPQPARPALGRLHVRQPAPGRALRHSARVRVAVPARRRSPT